MIVVPVLITNCQFSEKLKNGPLEAHNITISKEQINAKELPANLVIKDAKASKELFLDKDI